VEVVEVVLLHQVALLLVLLEAELHPHLRALQLQVLPEEAEEAMRILVLGPIRPEVPDHPALEAVSHPVQVAVLRLVGEVVAVEGVVELGRLP